MFSGSRTETKSDKVAFSDNLKQHRDVRTSQSSVATIQEYESLHQRGGYAQSGERAWNSVEIQNTFYDEKELSGNYQQRDIPYFEKESSGYGISVTSTKNSNHKKDPFNNVPPSEKRREPLKADRNSTEDQKNLQKRRAMLTSIYTDGSTGREDYDSTTEAAVDNVILQSRVMPSDIQPECLEHRFQPKSDRLIMQEQARNRWEKTKLSTIGRLSYGSYGV